MENAELKDVGQKSMPGKAAGPGAWSCHFSSSAIWSVLFRCYLFNAPSPFLYLHTYTLYIYPQERQLTIGDYFQRHVKLTGNVAVKTRQQMTLAVTSLSNAC